MSLARSLFTGISGLANHQQLLDVIGDNISNVNTTGFKKSRVTFETQFSQTIAGPVAPSGTSFGGINALEIGLGVKTSATGQLFSQGGLEVTGRREDLAVQGSGFFAVEDGKTKSTLFTRDGTFRLLPPPDPTDPAFLTTDGPFKQFLVTAGGQFVKGSMFAAGTTLANLPAAGIADQIFVPLGKSIPGAQTTVVDINGQLKSTGQIAAAAGIQTSEDLIDVIGTNLDGAQRFNLNSLLVNIRKASSPATAIFTAGDFEVSAKLGGRDTVKFTLQVDAGTTVSDLMRIMQDIVQTSNTANGNVTFETDGNPQAGSTTTTIIDATGPLAGLTSAQIVGKRIFIRDAGTGALVSRVITAFDGTTSTITMDSPVTAFPIDVTDAYTVVDTNSRFLDVATGVTASTLLFNNTAGTFYAQITDPSLTGLSQSDLLGKRIEIFSSAGAGNNGVISNIIAYNPATGTILLDKAANVANFPGGLGTRVSISIRNDYFVPAIDSTTAPPWLTFIQDNAGTFRSKLSAFGNFGTSFDITDLSIKKKGDFSTAINFNKTGSANGESVFNTSSIFDQGGNSLTLNSTFFLENKTPTDIVFHYIISSPDMSLQNQAAGTPLNPNQIVDEGTVTFNFDGSLKSINSTLTSQTSTTGSIQIAFPRAGYQNGVSSFNFTNSFINLKAIDVDQATVDMDQAGGFASGVLNDYSVGQDGIMTGVFSNGITQLLGQIALVQFKNEEGLVHTGSNLFQETENSGDRNVIAPGSSTASTANGLAPVIRQRVLESSNVELAKEFTDLIIAQRGFQANARTVTVTNSILQELLNLI